MRKVLCQCRLNEPIADPDLRREEAFPGVLSHFPPLNPQARGRSRLAPEYGIVAALRLDNRQELQAAVSSVLPGEDWTDDDLVLSAYRVWGKACLQRLRGDFAFSIWDGPRQRLFCARDRMGTVPLYYHFRPGELFSWSTESRALTDFPGVGRDLDETTVACHLYPRPGHPHRSFFRRISQLPPAHSLTVSEEGMSTERYWDIDPGERLVYRHDGEYEEHYRQLLREVVASRLEEGRTGILLSGGIDSTTIAGTAGTIVMEGNGAADSSPLWEVSYAFSELEECDERRYSDQVAGAWGLKTLQVPADDRWMLSEDEDWDDPTVTTCPPLLRAAARSAREEGISVLLAGTGANALTGGNIPTHADHLWPFRLPGLYRGLARHHRREPAPWPRFLWRNLLWWVLPEQGLRALGRSRWIPKQPWLREDLARLVEGEGVECALPPGGPFREPSRRWRYSGTTSDIETRFCVAEGRTFNDLGVELRLPYRDARFFEFVMALPPDQLWRDGEIKSLPRRAAAGLVPEAVRTSRHRGSLSPLYNLGLREREQGKVDRLLEDPLTARFGFVEPGVLREEYRRYREGLRSEYGLSSAIHLEVWLRKVFGDA